MEASFPARRLSRHVLEMYSFTLHHLHEQPGNSPSRDPSRQRRDLAQPSFPVNTNSRVSHLSGTKGEHKFLADCIKASKNTLLSSKSVLNSRKNLLNLF